MNPKLIILILLCVFTVFLSAVSEIAYDYTSAWKAIDKLQDLRLPKSMAVKVDSLYEAAQKENKVDQQIRALIYQLKIQQQVEEFSAQKAIDAVKQQLQTASLPASAVMHSILAQLYWGYYQNNRWRFSQRSQIQDNRPDDIATWDLQSISQATIAEYQLSLQDPQELKLHSIADFPAFLSQGNTEDRSLRPTLYDFLAYRALDFYRNDESGLTRPFEEFSITDSKYFQPAAAFAMMTITTPDTLSLKYQAVLLYQDLIRFHLEDSDPSALVNVNLLRLEFMYNNCLLAQPEQYYEAALRMEISRYAEFPISSYASFKLASLYNSLADKYNPELSEAYRWYYKAADELCREAMPIFPVSFGARSCRVLSQNIRLQEITLNTETYVLPDAPIKALLGIKNLSGVKLVICRIPQVSITQYNNDEYNEWRKDDYKALKAMMNKSSVWTQTYEFDNEGDYRYHSYELPLEGLSTGRYLIIASNLGDENIAAARIMGYCGIIITAVSYVSAKADPNTLMLSNRSTGQALASTEIKVYYRTYDQESKSSYYKLNSSGLSDANGRWTFPKDSAYNALRISLISGTDTLHVFNYYGYNEVNVGHKIPISLLFTDRPIYRPGQTIYLKGLHYWADGRKYMHLAQHEAVHLRFVDTNGQTISTQKLQTNEFGTFHCTFIAPKGGLTGKMRIYSNAGSISVSVEEYKRPRFEVSLQTPKETFKLNQYLTMQGTAISYAGLPIDSAQVSYRVSRQPKYPHWFWWWGNKPDISQKEIAHGVAQTNAKGEFTISFLAAGDDTVLSSYNPYFQFSISADVSDIGGETRSATLSLNIGERELILNPVLGEYIDGQDRQLVIPIQATNLSGEPIAVSGNLFIARLQEPDHIQKKRLWNAPDRAYLERDEFLRQFPHDIYRTEDRLSSWKVLNTVFSAPFNTADTDSVTLSQLSKLSPGVYVLTATASHQQQETKSTRYFTIYNANTPSLPYPVADWFVPIKTTGEPGENAMVLIGSAYEGSSVLYELEKDHAIVESLRFTLNNEQRLFTLPITEADRGGFYLHFTYVRDSRLYIHDQFINVPWTNKQIEFEYMSFRDKLLPGQEEEWRIKLKDHKGGKLQAEVLASMYDASLDAFCSNTWTANVYRSIGRSAGWGNNNFIHTLALSQISSLYRQSYPSRSYDAFNWLGYPIPNFSSGLRMSGKGKVAYAMIESDRLGSTREIDFAPLSVASLKDPPPLSAKTEDLSGVQARANFAETAFFYPELRTDEKGEISFVFTVPEALTRWKFRALALTQDFQIGSSERSTITQKPLMVIPNAPRFFREGDSITFSSKIAALDERDQSGKCQLFLFDAITMAPVDGLFGLSQAQQPFFVKKGESTVLHWELNIPFGINAVTYRVVARAADFSDGEENTLPILSNRMLVTESIPLPVSGNSTKSFVFEKLLGSASSSSIKHHKLTLEYSSNPAWYAVQALPYLMEHSFECSDQIFNRYYANSLATHIANSNPRIKRVFDSWRDTPNSTALLSNLEKNQELKAVLLQETPWVMDASTEAESKQRIGLLFELNHMTEMLDTAFSKLRKMQNPSGAWSWFPDMPDSWWITQYIVEGFGHLDHLGVKSVRTDQTSWKMLNAAIGYMDQQILQDYQELLKHGRMQEDHLGYMEMHYLYARSFFRDIEIPTDVRVAVDYFQAQADQYWLRKNLYGQGLIALALHRNENKLTPPRIIASLKERALHNEELGMWWKNDQGWFWYQAPIETQSLLIEAFHDVAGDTLSIDAMRTWLLKQKQTNNWKTSKATSEACFALLLSGTEWLNTELLAEITIGGSVLDPRKLDGVSVEAGSGYFKTSWSAKEINTELAKISVQNPNRIASWGALYWQYFEDLDKITQADSPLRLEKKLFVERITATGKVLDPIKDKGKLAIGDKVIVRIELRSDRDMEYLHMKDMRSAGFEPINVFSGYRWQDGLGYYESTTDAATNFFIDYLRKGTYVFEYPMWVSNKGDFSNGITSIQCMYAPEFSAHSEGIRVKVK